MAEALRKLWDADGDEWVERADGWCCQGPCDHDGVEVYHPCSEHDHFALSTVEVRFGPLSDEPKEASRG